MVIYMKSKWKIPIVALVSLLFVLGSTTSVQAFSWDWFTDFFQPTKLSIVGSYHTDDWVVEYDRDFSTDECKDLDAEFELFTENIVPRNDGGFELSRSPVKTFCGEVGGVYDKSQNIIYTGAKHGTDTIEVICSEFWCWYPIEAPDLSYEPYYLSFKPVTETKVIGIKDIQQYGIVGDSSAVGTNSVRNLYDNLDGLWLAEYDVEYIKDGDTITDATYTFTGNSNKCVWSDIEKVYSRYRSSCTFGGIKTLSSDKVYFLRGCDPALNENCEDYGFRYWLNGYQWISFTKEVPPDKEPVDMNTKPILKSFELVKSQDFTESYEVQYTVPREEIPTYIHYREYSCPIGGDYHIVSDTFYPGETITIDDLNWNPAYFCKRHPAIIVDKGTSSTENDVFIYKNLLNGIDKIVPDNQEITLFYVSDSPESKEIQQARITIGELNSTLIQYLEELEQLALSIEEKANLIANLHLSLGEQAIAIEMLSQEAEEQAVYISALTQNIGEQAQLISQLTNTAEEQSLLISELHLSVEDQALLIAQLTITTEEQAQIINGLGMTIADQSALILELTDSVEEQAQIIDSLELNLEEKAILIQELSDENDIQAQLISDMQISLVEKAYLIQLLTVENEEQAGLISQMELSFADQGEIITALNLLIEGDADIIQALTDSVVEQGSIIDGMELMIEEQVQLIQLLTDENVEQGQIISQLEMTVEDKVILIQQLTQNLDEQIEIIANLEASASEVGQIIIKLTENNQIQAQIIEELKVKASEQGEIIRNMELGIEEMSVIINTMNTTLRDQAEIIIALELSLTEEQQLIDSLDLSMSELNELLMIKEQIISERESIIAQLELEYGQFKEQSWYKDLISAINKMFDKILALLS